MELRVVCCEQAHGAQIGQVTRIQTQAIEEGLGGGASEAMALGVR